jgi:hypothetical protein
MSSLVIIHLVSNTCNNSFKAMLSVDGENPST